MKKYILPVLAISMLLLVLSPNLTMAVDTDGDVTTEGMTPPDIELTLWGTNSILTKALNWVFGIVIIIAAIMLIWAGFTYVTSGGNAEKMKTALNSVIYALIGIAIAVLAKGLVFMICRFVGGTAGECKFF